MVSRLRFEVRTFHIQSRITVYLIRTFDYTCILVGAFYNMQMKTYSRYHNYYSYWDFLSNETNCVIHCNGEWEDI